MSRASSSSRRPRLKAFAKRVLDRLRSDYAPALPSLVYNPCMPERHLALLVRWADDLASADPFPALDLAVLEKVLPALNGAFLASFAFKGVPTRDPLLWGWKVDLELTDRGGGLVVQGTRTCASLLAAGLHGDAGAALAARADQELREAMDAISQAIARRRH